MTPHHHRTPRWLPDPLLFLVVVTIIFAGSTTGAPAPRPAPPNIVLVMPDDIGYGDYSCLGNPILKTPAVDAFWAQSVRFTLFNNTNLFDLQNDPGETRDIRGEHPDIVATLRQAYDEWWQSVQPGLVNEYAVGPKVNPFKAAYWRQFGGGPNASLLRQMDPGELTPKIKAIP